MRIQFESARDVFLAFPTLESDLAARPGDAPPLDYLAALVASETPEDAVTFFSYLAPKREAVWWACCCIRLLSGETAGARGSPLAFAETWVKEPDEDHRRAALHTAEAADSGTAETWAAYGAAWSGGNLAPDGNPPILAAPHLTAKAVRAAVLIAIADGPPRERGARLRRCFDEAVRIAHHDMEAELG